MNKTIEILKDFIEPIESALKVFEEKDTLNVDITREEIGAIRYLLNMFENPIEKIIAPSRRKKKNTYEFGLIVGTKRERVYWEDKIKKKIEELKHADFLKLQLCYQHDNKAVAQIEALEELLKGETK